MEINIIKAVLRIKIQFDTRRRTAYFGILYETVNIVLLLASNYCAKPNKSKMLKMMLNRNTIIIEKILVLVFLALTAVSGIYVTIMSKVQFSWKDIPNYLNSIFRGVYYYVFAIAMAIMGSEFGERISKANKTWVYNYLAMIISVISLLISLV